MKRPILITTGALGGLGAVLAITPPQFTQNASVDLGTGGSTPIQSSEPVASNSPKAPTTPSPSSTTLKSSKPTSATSTEATSTKSSQSQAPSNSNSTSAKQTQSSASTQTQSSAPSQSPTPTPSKSEAPQTTGGNSGTFTGGTYDANRYGRVTVSITVKNGQITQSSGTQSPSSWSQNVIPTLDSWIPQGKITISQIMSYSASDLPCAIANSCRSRASYTATAYWSSVQSALKKAGY
jgi:outer membrane biosynthesis protein TonB